MSETISPPAEEPAAPADADQDELAASRAAAPHTAFAGGEQGTGPRTAQPAFHMLADSPLLGDAEDQLDFAPYADALAGLLDDPATDTPLTIAISAPWGAGKTTLANMVVNRLHDRPLQRGERPHIVCRFNAWLHDDAPHLGAAFAAEVAQRANADRALLRRIVRPLASAMLNPEQRWRRRILVSSICLLPTIALALVPAIRVAVRPGMSTLDAIKAVVGQEWAPAVVAGLAVIALWRKVFATAQSAARFVGDPKSESADGSMQQVHDQLGVLIRQAVRNPGRFGRLLQRSWPAAVRLVPRLRGRRRFVIIVDDLERCRPPRAVEVCEVASQLLGHRDVMTILVADMSTVAASAEIKYAQLETILGRSHGAATTVVRGAYGRAYLQKMVQLQFDLPPASPDDITHLIATDLALTGSAAGDGSARPGDSGTAATARSTDTPEPPYSAARPGRLGWLTRRVNIAAGVAALLGAAISALTVDATASKESLHSITTFLHTTFTSTTFVSVASAAAAVVAASSAMVTFVLNRRRRSAEKLDEEISARGAGRADVESLKQEVFSSDVARQGGLGLANQRFDKYIADDSVLRREAESEILAFLPGIPRSAKRLINHLRLLLIVASGRRMLGGTPALTAAHLGKWAVLWQRWPDLGPAVSANPALMADLEADAIDDPAALARLVRRSSPSISDLAELTKFLTEQPLLAGVATRLIYCLPAAGTLKD